MVRQRLIAVQLLDECITSAWNFEVCTELSTDRLGGGGGRFAMPDKSLPGSSRGLATA